MKMKTNMKNVRRIIENVPIREEWLDFQPRRSSPVSMLARYGRFNDGTPTIPRSRSFSFLVSLALGICLFQSNGCGRTSSMTRCRNQENYNVSDYMHGWRN